MRPIHLLSIIIFLLFSNLGNSQTVTIDQSTQRFLGSVSELDRSKYFVLHSNDTDTGLDDFYNDYNVSNGRGFWGPFSYANHKTGAVGQYPQYQNGGTEVRPVKKGFVSTEHPKNVVRYNLSKEAAAAWAVEYYKDFVDDNARPEFFEPMNEPFVHAGDAPYNEQQPDRLLMTRTMADWFGEIGKQIHQAPELANMKVIGYSSAWPSLEFVNFQHWHQYQKMFMDRAGEHMDGFSTHLYDGVNVTGQNNFRSGSNSEAILDMIEAYSHIKWGIVKPHAITEYGGIAQGYGNTYSDIESSQTVRSFNHIIFNLLEREDKMLISIPFAVGKATWFMNAGNNYQPYGAALIRPSNLGQPNPTSWVYTPKVHFYDLWKSFKGKRIDIKSDHFDIQTQAFVDGNKMYIAINNIHESTQNVNLNFVDGLTGLQNVRIKSLKIYDNQNPVFNNTVQNNSPSNITLIPGETVTLEYTFANNISFDNALRRKKYYTNKYLQAISSGSIISFPFNNVSTGTGQASLRMSIGRKHNVSKSPIVKVNGTVVNVPNNWTGYDQANRQDFFGTLVIPVPIELLGSNNNVTVQFPDNGGHISSMILEVQKYDTNPAPVAQAPYNGIIQSIPGKIEAEHFDLGGQGLAYNDSNTENFGAAFRTNEAVDIEGLDGGYTIGFSASGEWMEYTTNVTPGLYDISFRVASNVSGKKIQLSLDGEELDVIIVPSTTSWGNFQTVTINDVIIDSQGEQILRITFPDGQINLNWVDFVKKQEPRSAYPNGIAHPIPGLIEVEHYDRGGEGIAYHDSDNVNNGTGQFRTYEGVDLENRDNGLTLGWIQANEWVEYTTDVLPGLYDISFRTASPFSGKEFILTLDGEEITTYTIPNTGNWGTFQTNTISDIPIYQEGEKTLRLSFSNGNFNINWIEFVKTADNRTPFPNGIAHPIPGTIEAENFDTGGEGIAYHDNDAINNGDAQYRMNESVDIESRDGGYTIGWAASGEWIEYTVDVTEGFYNISSRVATIVPNTSIVFKMDGEVIGTKNIEETGDWENFVTQSLSGVYLEGGQNRILRIEFPQGSVNLNYLQFIPEIPTADVILGNPLINSPHRDGWSSTLVVDETSIYTNTSGTTETVFLNTFDFYAKNPGNPVTPFVVKVNGDNDFTVLKIGTTRTTDEYILGMNSFSFLEGNSVSIPLSSGETIAAGFMTGGPDGEVELIGGVIPFTNTGNHEMWFTGAYSSVQTFPTITEGQIPTNGSGIYTNLNRTYSYNIGLSIVENYGGVQGRIAKTDVSDLVPQLVHKIYPNPLHTSQALNIVFEDPDKSFDIQIFSLTGNLIYSANSISEEIDIRSNMIYNEGVYFLKVIDTTTGQKESHKLIFTK